MTPTQLPLLHGKLAAEVRGVADAISRGLLRLGATGFDGPSLYGGAAGVAVAHAYLDQLFPGRGHARRASRLLHRAIEDTGGDLADPSFDPGFVGVAWAYEHVHRGLGAGEDPNDDVDGALESAVAASPWTGHFDLVSGLVGIGLYALERLPRPSGVHVLEHVIARLGELARPCAEGVAWETELELLPLAVRRRKPSPCFDLGLAHGTPAVVVLLAAACARGIATAQARSLLQAATCWLLAQRLPHDRDACFPAVAGAKQPARTAWCYGDPGVAAALLQAARCANEPAWEHAALQIALCAARRPMAHTRVVDAGLCHGAAGVAHVFHRLYRATGHPALADAARRWIRIALDMRVPRRGLAGYRAWVANASGQPEPMRDVGFLTGSAGIALAFASAIQSADPGWDRALLLS